MVDVEGDQVMGESDDEVKEERSEKRKKVNMGEIMEIAKTYSNVIMDMSRHNWNDIVEAAVTKSKLLMIHKPEINDDKQIRKMGVIADIVRDRCMYYLYRVKSNTIVTNLEPKLAKKVIHGESKEVSSALNSQMKIDGRMDVNNLCTVATDETHGYACQYWDDMSGKQLEPVKVGGSTSGRNEVCQKL